MVLTVLAALLALSEVLPFLKQTRANGVLHTLLLVLEAGVKQLKVEKGEDASQSGRE